MIRRNPRNNIRVVAMGKFILMMLLISVSNSSVAGEWKYDQSVDKMRGTNERYATLESTTRPNFEFPYSGGSVTTLLILATKDHYYVKLSTNKGQFLQKRMWFKFDNGPVIDSNSIGDLEVDDDDPRNVSLAIGYGNALVSKIMKSKHMTIEAEFYGGEKQPDRIQCRRIGYNQTSKGHRARFF